MPCIDGDYDKYFEREQRERLDKVTRLLCFVCRQIEFGDKANFDCDEAKELWLWWQEHKKLDEQRENNNATK